MTATCDIGPAKAQLRARAEAIIAENPTTVPREAQQEFDSLMAAMNMLDQVNGATLNGVSRTTRTTQSQSQYEMGGGDNHSDVRPSKRTGRVTAEQLFNDPQPSAMGFKSIEDVCRAQVLGDQRVLMLSGASSGVPSDGGFLIPPQFAYDMLNKAAEKELVRPNCRIEAMTGPSKTIATHVDESHASGLVNGVALQWIPEGGEIDFQFSKSRQLVLNAKKAVLMTAATNELLSDVPNYGTGIADRLIESLSWGLDRSFLASGIGAGRPVSILNSDSTITVAKEAGQPASTIVYENLTKMLSRLHPGCFSNSCWVFNQSAIPQLLSLSIPVGTGGSVVPVMTESNGQFKILTRPCYFSEKLNSLGALGDSLLVDFSQYCVGIQKDGMRLDMSSHLLFKTDESAWRLILRVDGQPTWNKAFQPVNSAPTLSWAVTLAARS